jgi:hypothetical protein
MICANPSASFWVGLVHLHLERGTRVPGIEAGDIEPSRAEFMHEPRRHRPRLDPDPRIASRVPTDHPRNLLRVGRALATPEPTSGVVDNADRSQLL